MTVSPSLRVAINLQLMPMQSGIIKKARLPEGMGELLAVAAGDEAAMNEAALALQRPRDEIRKAAGLFVETILLSHDSDSYRVLGATPDATIDELRRNMALIARYLHPDIETNGERSLFMSRVAGAWNDLKTPEKRAAYDRMISKPASKGTRKKSRVSSDRKKTSEKPYAGSSVRSALVPVQQISRKRIMRGLLLRQVNRLLMMISGR